MRLLIVAVLTVVVLVLLVVFAGNVAQPRSTGSSSTGVDTAREYGLSGVSDSSRAYQPEATKVAGMKLFFDYQANEVAADQKYKGKRLEVRDLVTHIRKDFLDHIVLDLATTNEFESISAYLADNQEERAAALQVYNVVTLNCVGAGMVVTSPMLKDCIIIERPERSPATLAQAVAPAVVEPTPDEKGVYSITSAVTPPHIVYAPEPQFSEEARKEKIGGTVTVHLVVDANGQPRDLTILKPLGSGLDEEALAAVGKYRFKAASYKGEPIATAMNVEVNFQIF